MHEHEYSVKTATGKEYEVRWCGATVIGVTSVLYIEFIGYQMMQIVPVFSNADETSYIQGLEKGNVIQEYRGYTNLFEANILAESGNLRIALSVPIENEIGV